MNRVFSERIGIIETLVLRDDWLAIREGGFAQNPVLYLSEGYLHVLFT